MKKYTCVCVCEKMWKLLFHCAEIYPKQWQPLQQLLHINELESDKNLPPN